MRYVTEAKYAGDYKVRLKFNSGEEFLVNLESFLDGEIHSPLKDLKIFSRFSLHPDLETLTWENGADFAPEFLYEIGQKQLSSTRKAK